MKVRLETTNVFTRNRKANKVHIIVNRGGTRSSKSYSLLQLLIYKCLTETKKKILILRKSLPSLKLSTFIDFKTILSSLNLNQAVKEEKQDRNYYLNNNLIHFDSLDDPSKKKSTSWNYMFFEEATEFTKNDFMTTILYLTAPTKKKEENQIYMAFNPVDEYCWLKTDLIDNNNYDIKELVSTYKDNAHNLNPKVIERIEKLKDQDHNFYRIYCQGQWGKLEHLVYNNWDTIPEQDWPTEFDEIIYGLDFGFNNPSALIKIGFKDQEIFEEELLYESGLTNPMLIQKLSSLISEDEKAGSYIYADSAEPARIEEIHRAGFFVKPMEKGKGSVGAGIDKVKTLGTVHVKKDSINLIKEKQTYSWKTDKDNRPIDGETVKYRDHLMDGERGALYTYLKNRDEGITVRMLDF